jgi:hypothetical protein
VKKNLAEIKPFFYAFSDAEFFSQMLRKCIWIVLFFNFIFGKCLLRFKEATMKRKKYFLSLSHLRWRPGCPTHKIGVANFTRKN